MRCAHCAGHIPESSKYCGICGRGAETVAIGRDAGGTRGKREADAASSSLFDLPRTGAARRKRIALVVGLDLILAGAGVFMIVSHVIGGGKQSADTSTFQVEEVPPAPASGAHGKVALEVEAQVEKHKSALLDCYQRAATAASPDQPLTGRMDIRFTIMPDGTPQDVRAARNTTQSEPLEQCVTAVVKEFRVEAAGDEPIDFAWPFLFRVPT